MSLPKLPAIRELVKLFGLSAKSQLGQNFILDKNITDKIVRTASLAADTPLVVEVGPGPGLLTRSILDTPVPNVVVIEKDPRFQPTLTQLAEATQHRVKVLQGDALRTPHAAILEKAGMDLTTARDLPIPSVHIMGNLPFNIATPLLLQWLHMIPEAQGLFGVSNKGAIMTLMFQKEVGDRMAAPVSSHERGRLAVMTQSVCDVEKVYKVPSTVFVPKPKVDASVIQMTPKKVKLLDDAATYKTLENLLRFYFTKKRKTVGHITKRLIKEVGSEHQESVAALEDILDFQARPSDIDTPAYCQAAKHLHHHGIFIP
ncbi:S-adenosyl-L-methionine-dependent methyltransferase [Hesseltinella vesiculosa]|uniref:rRNA adenine N(6)-methyltransferase n=1 Tax=Hesseltinella vesiculosa TaxID=101127 RepID=A0A1X2GEB3_9FUNG|nr:S-adenosyl-L-methionine-dependent methyltransferase [Hesseltinella vesiculosa]